MKYLDRRVGWALIFLAGLGFPFIVSGEYPLTVMTGAYIVAIATLGLNLITGYTGQFNLAHGGFMAIGAYTVGILTVDYQVPFWIAFVLAGVVTTVVGLPLGFVSLRLKGHFFSIFTMCVGYIIFLVIEKWESLTHGDSGIYGLPAPPGFGDFKFDTTIGKYYLVFAFLVVGTWLMHRIVTSLLGRTFMAIHNSDELAESLGINLSRNKLLSFLLSVFYAGIAGALYAGVERTIGTGMADVSHTFNMTMFMLVGGLGTVLGSLVGAIGVPWITQSLQFLQEYRFVVFGPLLILLVIFVPRGIVGTYLSWRAREASRVAQLGAKPAASAAANPGGAPHA